MASSDTLEIQIDDTGPAEKETNPADDVQQKNVPVVETKRTDTEEITTVVGCMK